MSKAAHAALDELVKLGGVHGWHVTDSRAERCVIWFSRGREYAHLGVDADGEVVSAYGGVRGRHRLNWATGSEFLGGQAPNRAGRLAEALRAQPFDRYETRDTDE